jgi:hypothetical protein
VEGFTCLEVVIFLGAKLAGDSLSADGV